MQSGHSTAPAPVAPPSSRRSDSDSSPGKIVGRRQTNSAMSTARAQHALSHVGFLCSRRNLQRQEVGIIAQ